MRALMLGGPFLALLFIIPSSWSNAREVPTLVVVAVAIYLTFKIIRISPLLRAYYTLIVQIPGASDARIVSKDENEINRLRRLVTDAISNPQAEFQITVDHIQFGDKIQQFGSRNVGKVDG